MFFWLAYIRLPDNHRWTKKKGYDYIPLDVHGGLTYMEKVDKNDMNEYWQKFTPGTWIGWDYGHAGDFTDYGMVLNPIYPIDEEDKRWEYDEVEKEVKEVIKQLLK